MNITNLKVIHAVNIGNVPQAFFKHDQYDINQNGPIITIRHKKTGKVGETPVTNAIGWIPLESPAVKQEPKPQVTPRPTTKKVTKKKAPAKKTTNS